MKNQTKYRTPSTFRQKVFAVVRRIPPGKTLSYKEVARRAGSPGAYRAVGNVLNKNYNPELPCHRVIKSNGRLGGYNRGSQVKLKKLYEDLKLVKKYTKSKSLIGHMLTVESGRDKSR